VSLRFDEEAAEEFYRAVEYYEAQSAGLGRELIEQRPGYWMDRL
jgi:hypothetical protein